MKKTIKTLIAISLVLTLVLSGSFTPTASDANDGIMLLHDGPGHDVMTH